MKNLMIIWVWTVRKFLDWFINGFLNLFISDNPIEKISLLNLYAEIKAAVSASDLTICFNKCFKGYQYNNFLKDLDSIWSPSFSSVYQMEEAVCTGAAGVNLYLAKKYAEILNIKPVKVFMFGIWNLKLNSDGHAMCVMVKEDSSCVLLDYSNAIPLNGLMAVNQYYQMNYEKGAGNLKDYFIIEFPAVKSYREGK